MSLQIIEWIDFLKNTVFPEPSAMTIGVFDGIHLGHRELIRRIVKQGPNPTIVTFKENPKRILSPNLFEGDIYSLKQKKALFVQMGVNRLILIDFSENFSKLSGRDFLNLLEDRGKMSFLAIGKNFRCGRHADTDADSIVEINRLKGIFTDVVPPVEIPPDFGNGPVSSSKLRSAIISGNLKAASALMAGNFKLDLLDVEGEAAVRENQHGLVYDMRRVRRIVPAAGRYPVLLYPSGLKRLAQVANGNVFLPDLQISDQVECIEFI